MLRKGAGAGSGRCRAAGWCPISVRRCTIGVNAKLPWCLSLFKIHSSSDAPRNEFAGGERGDNRGTKCPDPKALLDGIQQRFFICVHGFLDGALACAIIPSPACIRTASLPRFAPSLRFFPVQVVRSRTARCCAHAVRAYPVGVRETRPLHSAFADRAVGKTVGSSPTSRMQKREYGWMSSAGRWFGAGEAAGAVRSSWGRGQLVPAFPSCSTACMPVPAPSQVVAFASIPAAS
ncbi:hypothetical protein BCO19218_04025 [Burkholderia contaminans]|nr:hypothetical protein BCO19218_04025 [Burkholderia contaminans]